MRRIASIDIGSQTIRLLVADLGPDGRLYPVFKNQAIIRLGEKAATCGTLQKAAIQRAVDCIADFKVQAEARGAATVYAAATACVRSAENNKDFIQAVSVKAGIVPMVLSGEQEAHTALAGVLSMLDAPDQPLVLIDIGGGSTECIMVQSGNILRAQSMPLGVISLTETFLVHDPPTATEVRSLQSHIAYTLSTYTVAANAVHENTVLAGTAGTITTLAAMDLAMTIYEPAAINGYLLTQKAIQKLFEDMLCRTSAQRAAMAGLEQGRSTVMPAGTAVVLEIMRVLNRTELIVSDAGLLEGILIMKSGNKI